MHCEFEEFLLVFSLIPSFFLHHCPELVELVRECILRVAGVELKTFALGKFHNLRRKLSRQFSHLAENHVPCILVDCRPARLTLEDVHQVHQGGVLHILAERCHEWRITETRPYIFYFLEQHDHQLIKAELILALSPERCIDSPMEAFQVSHHGSHHTARQTAAYKQGTHMRVVRVDPVSEELVDEFLGQTADFHVCVHVQILHLEPVGFHHFADSDYVRMDFPPAERFDSHIKIVSACTGHLQHGSRGESRTAMSVVLDFDVRIFLLDL